MRGLSVPVCYFQEVTDTALAKGMLAAKVCIGRCGETNRAILSGVLFFFFHHEPWLGDTSRKREKSIAFASAFSFALLGLYRSVRHGQLEKVHHDLVYHDVHVPHGGKGAGQTFLLCETPHHLSVFFCSCVVVVA